MGAKCGPIIFGTKKISIYQTRTSSPLTQRAKLSVVVRLTPGPYSFAKLWSWFISDDSVLHILLLKGLVHDNAHARRLSLNE